MVTAVFTDSRHTTAYGLWQYDYGQTLRIQGLDLPTAVEVHFALNASGGDAITRVGVTSDGVTNVPIPDSALENGDAELDYNIYAYVYVTDETSGETQYAITLPVTARSKPEAYDTPEDAELFREAIALINASVEEAKQSAEAAEESVTLAQSVVDSIPEDYTVLVENVNQQAKDIIRVEDTSIGGKYRPELIVGSLWNTGNDGIIITNNAKRVRTTQPIRGLTGLEARLVQTDRATEGALYNVVVMYVDDETGTITVGAWKTLATPMRSGLTYYFSLRDKNNLATAEQIAADIDAGNVYLEVVALEHERRNHGGNMVRCVAHRGDAINAPENTMSAYRQAVRSGYQYMESDVHFTADGVPVMLHDDTIDRTSNGSGNVSDYTLAQLKELDFGSWKSNMYVGEKIPTFMEMLAFCRNTGIIPLIELKGQTQAQVAVLVDYVEQYGLLNTVHWVSFNATCLEYVRGLYADANLCHVQRTTTTASAATVAGWKTGNNEVGILCYNNATEASADICREAGVYMMAMAETATDVLTAPTYVTWYTVDGINAAQVLYDNAMGEM